MKAMSQTSNSDNQGQQLGNQNTGQRPSDQGQNQPQSLDGIIKLDPELQGFLKKGDGKPGNPTIEAIQKGEINSLPQGSIERKQAD